MPIYRTGANIYTVVQLWGQPTGGAANTANYVFQANIGEQARVVQRYVSPLRINVPAQFLTTTTSYNETGLSIAATATVTCTDQADLKEVGSPATASAVRFSSSSMMYTRAATGLGTGTDVTMACWAKITVDTDFYAAALAVDNAGSNYLYLGTQGNGTNLCVDSNGGGHGPGVSATVGTWYYLAFTFKSAAADSLFIAAAPATTLTEYTSFNMAAPLDAGTFFIAQNGFSSPWNGSIAAVKLWTAALTKTELEAEMGAYAPVRTANLWAAYKFNNGPQTTDDSGNGRTLTQGGTPTTDTSGPPLGGGGGGLLISVAATVTSTDAYTVGHVGYNETGRSITAVAAVTATDQADFKEPGLALPVAATVTITAKQGTKELALAVPIAATVTATDKQAHKELGLSNPVTATVTETDLIHRKELGLSVPVVGTTTMAVDLARLHETALSVPVTATTTVTTAYKGREFGLSIPVTGTTTLAIDRAGYKNLSASVPIVGFVTVVDLQQSPGHYDETQRSILITGITTLSVDRAKYRDPSSSVPVAASITSTDVRRTFEPTLGIAVAATVSITTLVHFRDATSLPIAATTTLSVDQADFEEHPVTLTGSASVTCTDSRRQQELTSVAVVATVAGTDRAFFRQLALPIDVSAITVGTDSLGVLALLAFLVTATIKVTDFKSRTGVTLLNDADMLFLGDERVDRVYVGASQAWP